MWSLIYPLSPHNAKELHRCTSYVIFFSPNHLRFRLAFLQVAQSTYGCSLLGVAAQVKLVWLSSSSSSSRSGRFRRGRRSIVLPGQTQSTLTHRSSTFSRPLTSFGHWPWDRRQWTSGTRQLWFWWLSRSLWWNDAIQAFPSSSSNAFRSQQYDIQRR